jgi:thioredoxin reductase (NADPH)
MEVQAMTEHRNVIIVRSGPSGCPRASRIMVDRARANPEIHWAYNSKVADILGDGQIRGLTLQDTVNGEKRDIEVGGLFIAIGHEPRSELLKGQTELEGEGHVLTHGGTHTNLAGVFAAGDLVDHAYRQAITAAGTGCQSALDAERYLSAIHNARGEAQPESAAALAVGTI